MGKRLASKIGSSFVDLDHEVEQQAGSTISAFFSAHGEEAFRQLESKVLKEFPYPEHSIIATGGGAPCYADNMQWMNANGTTVYIDMSPLALARRLEKGREKRPLLKNLNDAELVAFIEGKLAERRSFYQQAQLMVDGLGLTADALNALLQGKSSYL